MITFAETSSGTREKIARLATLAHEPRTILGAAAHGVCSLLKRHFMKNDETPNKLGGERTHFWCEVADSTHVGPITDAGADIVVEDHRFAQKVFGGPIFAQQARALTIPMSARAHGHTVAEFKNRFNVELFRIGNLLLARHGIGIEVAYLLKPRVHQRPEAKALPKRYEIDAAAMEGAKQQFEIELRRLN